MAKELTKIRVHIAVDAAGVPQSATVYYRVADGKARKSDTYVVPTPDWNKTFHNTGAVGEFLRDTLDAVKAVEGI